MLNGVLSDYFAQKENYLTAIEPRSKTLFVAAAIIITICSENPYPAVVAAFLSAVFLLSTRIAGKVILLRLCIPLGIALVVLVTQFFFYGTTPVTQWNIFGLHVTGYREGLLHGFLIMGKVIGTVSLVVFLSMTTPVNKLIGVARWLRMPGAWIEITMLAYRYVFVLLEDAVTVRNAQKVRLGYSSPGRSLRSLGHLAGMVVIRAYDQSVSTYESMVLRGYKGEMPCIAFEKKFQVNDLAAVFIFLSILALLAALNIWL